MNNTKRAVVRLAAMLFCALLLAGCAGKAEELPVEPPAEATPAPAEEQPPSLTIGWHGRCANPYVDNTTLTIQLASLVFEPMTCIAPDLELEYRLASAVTSENGIVTITPAENAFFSDGTPVSAGDLAASLKAACASAAYKDRFSHVTSVNVQKGAVVVRLDRPDSLFAFLLDIPVIKAKEVGQKRPTPGGRYGYGEDGNSLVRAEGVADPAPEVIHLAEADTSSSLLSSFSNGELNLYAAETDRTSSAFSATETPFHTNTMVFLGVNQYAENPLCATAEGRQALSALIDRTALNNACYEDRAYPALGLLNSFLPLVRGQQPFPASQDADSARALLAQLGFSMEAGGTYIDAEGTPAAVRLLLYTGNVYRRYAAVLLCGQLQDAGIQAELVECDTQEEFLTAIENQEFELYIGEIKLYNNMDFSVFWGGSLGTQASEALLAACDGFCRSSADALTLERVFAAELPFIPLLWRNAMVVTGANAIPVTPSLSGPFYSFNGASG